ncbi:phage NrS-1 polymerase family protein [Halopiger aswanensis]|uniref:NrS-1 polymerase-like HBD domain-containing protein n=1 Tax=Halopiger aswanensis TaxID=148449 RepID=A0A419VXN6_9EURY|nr:hypothetical protein [Halopiger aswanensis]RKD87987.1 hypothetical protein ATJ93_4473 [Halopiger aswanensis]
MSEHSSSERFADPEVLPDQLTEREQWICWREENRDDKPTKVPVDPTTGDFASTTDDRAWTDLEEALEYVAMGAADGIGFVFTVTDPLVGVDLDDCRDPETGEPLGPATTIIERLDSFTEVSPSGTGYHVILEGELPDGRNRHDSIEMYDQARFFTVTGDHVEGTPTSVIEQQKALEAVHDEFVVVNDTDETDTSDVDEPSGADQTQSLELEDEELLEKARSANNGDKFDRLWRGNISGYESQSEADMALCCLLAFWTGCDTTRVDRLFRQSGLMRDKWDEVHYADGSTYGEKTIERAITRTDDVYEPSSETGTETSTSVVDQSSNETRGTDNRPVSSSVTADTEATGGTDQAAYLAEKNQLLSERMAELEATIEQKDERIEELESENQALREALTTCKKQLEDRNQSSALEDTEAAADADSIWNRTKRLLRGDE